MTKIDGLEIVMTQHIKSAIDKELKKRKVTHYSHLPIPEPPKEDA